MRSLVMRCRLGKLELTNTIEMISNKLENALTMWRK